MRRRLFVVLFASALTLLTYGYVPAKEPVDTKVTGLQYISEFEGGKLYRAGEVRLLELTGSYRQMGALIRGACEGRSTGDAHDNRRDLSE